MVNEPPFLARPIVTETLQNNIRRVEGDNESNFITANNTNNSILIGNDGDDVIIGSSTNPNRAVILAGKGDDFINSGYQDIIVIKDGDGHDTISSDFPYYFLNIEHDNPWKYDQSSNSEVLFNMKVENDKDLLLTYSNSGDSVLLKDFYDVNNNIRGNINLSVYDKSHDKMQMYYLSDLLSQYGMSKSDLETHTYTVYNTDINSYWTSWEGAGYTVGGEIAYQYLNTGTYNFTSNTENVFNNLNNNNTILQKQ